MPDKFTQLLPALGALVAFLVAAVLVLYIYRLLFGRRIRSPGGRNRARRLDVVDVYDLDRERQLVIVRRDNVEHLLLIGGPTDVLVEATINRLEGAVSRGPEQRPGQPPAAANWPAGPPAPPRELETPLPKPAAAGPVNLPPDLFAPAPPRPAAPPPPPPPPPAGPRVSSPAAPQRPAPPRSPTPPFLARAQQRLAPRPKEPPPSEAAAPPPPPPAAPPRPAEPPPAAQRPAAPPPPAPPAVARPAAPPPAPPPRPAAPPPPPPPAPADVDPLDSLEAEMARLLGRSDQKE